MSVNVWNLTDKVFSDHVRGTEIRIDPYGHAMVTEKKAQLLLTRHEGKLSLQDPARYTDDDVAALGKLSKADLLRAARALMRGNWVDVRRYPASADAAPAGTLTTE
jgi:hypothetical protein